MIEIDGYRALDALYRMVKVWMRRQLAERLLLRTPEGSELPYEVRSISESASKELIAHIARNEEYAFFAASANETPVKLSSKIFESSRGTYRRIRLRTYKKVEVEGASQIKLMSLKDFVADDLWKDKILDDLAIWHERGTTEGQLDLRRYLRNEGSLSNVDRVSFINWSDGSVDLSERRIAMQLKEDLAILCAKAERHGFRLPYGLRSLPFEESFMGEAALADLEGKTIFVKFKDYDQIKGLLFPDGKSRDGASSHRNLPVDAQILEIFYRDSKLSKSQIKTQYFGDLSVRKFNMYWAMAAEEDPKLSRPGPKSQH